MPNNANISATSIKELRERTGAGFLDCKNALVENAGDFETAVDFLRKKGLASVAKKAGRIAAEGVVAIAISKDEKRGAVIELNSETDFVARTDDFLALARKLADRALEQQDASPEDIAGDDVTTLTVKLGENIRLRRVERLTASDSDKGQGKIVAYVHSQGAPGIGRIAALLSISGSAEAAKSLGGEITMQIAAQRPQWLDKESVPAEQVKREREVLRQQVMEDPKSSSKPAEIIEKMIDGRLKKFYADQCLMEQSAIMETSQSVAERVGDSAKVIAFLRIEVGEGIEKKKDDFAEEVAAQVQASQ